MKNRKQEPAATLPFTDEKATHFKPPLKLKDRYGFTTEDLLEVQRRQLVWWKHLLQPEHYAALEAYCNRINCPAPEGEDGKAVGLHIIPRGCELSQFLEARARFVLREEDEPQDWMRTFTLNLPTQEHTT